MAFNFNGNTPKKILYNGLNIAKLVFNGVVVWLAKTLTTITGYPITLTNSVGDDLVDYKIYGNSVQDGTPTPAVPIEVKSVGEYDEITGKYKIPIKVNNSITNIYLDEPLRGINGNWDYVDFKNKKVIRNIKKAIFDGSEESWGMVYDTGLFNISHPPVSNQKTTERILLNNRFKFNSRTSGMANLSNGEFGTQPAYNSLFVRNNSLTTLNDFISWLKENTIELYYPLEIQEEETIELPTIPTNEGTNIIEVDTTINPSNMEVVYYKN